MHLNVNFHRGYLLPEYEFINYLAYDYTHGLDVSLLKETKGKSEWEQIFNYPSYGISFFYSSLGNDEVFGREFAINPFFRIKLLQSEKFNFYNQTGLGIAYVTKKFDLEENYLNVAVGSNFNLHFNFRLGLEYQLAEKFGLHAGLSFDHFSNANTSEPNLGLNYLNGFAGFNYRLGASKELQTHEIPDNIRAIENELILGIGGKHSRALSSKYYQTLSLSFEKRKSFFRVLHLGLGIDFFYDSSVEDQLLEAGKSYTRIDDFQSGVHLSQTLVYNRFSISIQEGLYIGLTEQIENYSMYNRGIFKYWATEQVSIRLVMKSHLHILDYPEIGIGLKL